MNPLDPRFRLTPASSLVQARPTVEVSEPDPGQLAASFSRKRFGLPVRPVPAAVTLSTTVTTLLGADPKRLFWLVINRGATDVTIGVHDPTITSSQGILLAAGGGYASMDLDEDGENVAYAVYAVAASGSPVVYTLQAVGI